jgi:hypothetical protein
MGYGYGMGSFGFIGMLFFAALLVVPFWRILPRVGLPNWVALFAVFPPVALILLWVVAFKEGES